MLSSSTHRQRPSNTTNNTIDTSSSSSSSTGSARSTSRPNSKAKQEYAFPSHLNNPTPYDIFHFTSRGVTSSEIKARYYDLVRSLHPDRFTTTSFPTASVGDKTKTQAEEEFKLVVAAYNLLKDRKKKELYDRAGLGWASSSPLSSSDPWRDWQDRRYTRRYNPSYTGAGHDKFGWQNSGFYSNQYSSSSSSYQNGWSGHGQYASNGVFISTLFVVTWVLAGLQYGRLSLQSQKAIERADRSHLDAAKSLNDAREQARSELGRARYRAFRQRAREQKTLELLEDPTQHSHLMQLPSAEEGKEPNPYGVGHGGPSGKHAAQERFAKATAQKGASD